VRCNDETNTHTFYVDGVQLEAGLPTSTAIGTMGAGYAWSGTAHNSTTVRTVTVVNPTTHVGLLSSNATWTVATWVRVPYAADATWNTYPLVWDARGADNNNRAYVWFDQSTDTWEVYINGGFRLSSAAQTFAAGAWVYLVVTADFTNDAYALYVDGALVDTDTTALTVPVLTAWRLGSVYDGTYQCGFTIAEYAVFDALLTADEIAALYAFNKPLVDTGAIDKPGIYLYDGQFRLASNSSGARIEMTNAEIAGYDSGGTKQFYLRATDGVGCAGAGAVRLDSTGLVFDSSTGISSTCAWKSGATTYGRIYALHDAGPTYHALYLNVPSIAALDSVFWVDVDAPAGYEAAIHLSASNGTDVGGLEIYDDAGTFTARLYSTEHVLIQCGASDYIALSGGYTYSTYDIRVSAIGGIYVGGDVNVDSGDVWCTGEISTDGGTTKWDLGGYSVGAPTIEGYLTVVVNGSTYRLAAEAV
jgi:hypothetical protein